MRGSAVVPASSTASREGLELTLSRACDETGTTLALRGRSGATSVKLLPEKGHFLFGHGDVLIMPRGSADGRAFADDVAHWLGLELGAPETDVEETTQEASLAASWIRLGDGTDPSGTTWVSYKLSLRLGERYAEIFLRLSKNGDRAQLVEKWSAYRERLVAILERVLSNERPRRVQRRETPVFDPDGRMLLSIDGAMEVAIPSTWIASAQPGYWRLGDPNDEMVIELSCMRLPPLPAGAPDVTARLRAVVDDSEHRSTTTPIATGGYEAAGAGPKSRRLQRVGSGARHGIMVGRGRRDRRSSLGLRHRIAAPRRARRIGLEIERRGLTSANEAPGLR